METSNEVNKKLIYMQTLRPILRRGALFSDMTEEFLFPVNPKCYEEVTIRFRTGSHNVEHVYIYVDDEEIEMQLACSQRGFDYYEAKVQLKDKMIKYHFKVTCGFETCYYDLSGARGEVREMYRFKLTPGFETPDWAKGAVMYQIFVDRFCNGDETNDVKTDEYCYINENVTKVEEWNKYPAAMGVREFYGGDLQGVWEKLDYLQELGVEVLYFNPLFVSPSNHKYDIQDYDYIDPHFAKIVKDEGSLLETCQRENRYASRFITRVTDKVNLEASNAFFAKFVEEVHKRGMKVILDGVFNHCGSFNKWMDRECIYENAPGYEKGAYVAWDSPYRNFFKFYDDMSWPYNANYNGWWGHDTLPKLNYEESPELYEYVMKIAKKWVSPPYNVDGWRLDVAADLGQSNEYNHKFWQDFRKAVKEANPNALILAEHYGDPEPWLQGNEWDTVMNYDAFMEPITWFLTGVEKHSDHYREDLRGNANAFIDSMIHNMSKFQGQSVLVAMNELSNHDHSRFMTRTSGRVGRTHSAGPNAANIGINKGIMKEAVIMQMTWQGAPTIYYGDEAGLCGWTDPDNRRTYPWGNEDQELIDFHKAVIRIHKENEALRRGSYYPLNYAYNILVYGRFLGDNIVATAINNNAEPKRIEVPVWKLGMVDYEMMERLILSTEESFDTEPVEYTVEHGKIVIELPAYSGAIFRKQRGR
ncbi:MAG: glycoside hydrolase family 13 protein [Lachnospiraceae bacterium]|nr:glycoside hydrolase family 13 protein [Lachnospiraceae bacterium]